MNDTYPKKLSTWEEEIVRYFSSNEASSCKSMEELLCKFYFRQQDSRALILQGKDHYCVLFLSPEIFNDEQLKKDEIDRFFKLIGVIRRLKEQGLISLYRAVGSYGRVMSFLQDDFIPVQPNNNKMLLNHKGDYTASPDTIHDKNGGVLYKGVIFDSDYYQMINNAVTGNLYLSSRIAEDFTILSKEPKQTDGSVQSTPHTTTSAKLGPSVLVGLGALLLIMATCLFFSFRSFKHTELIAHLVDSSLYLITKRQDSLTSISISNPIDKTEVIVTEDSMQHFGIDISHWNGNIMQHPHATDSLTFAVCKATEGVDGVDPDFRKNWQYIKSKNLIRGAYHFFRFEDDPIAQAGHFFKTAVPKGLDSLDMPLIIDIEELSLAKSIAPQKAKVQSALLECMKEIEKLSGCLPMLYTDHSFATTYLDDGRFSRYPLWIADYTKSKEPKIPLVWKTIGYKIWQRSDSFHLQSRVVDYDIYYGAKRKLLNGS